MPLERFGVSMESELLAEFDGLLRRKGYSNRSEAIRDLVRRELVDDAWGDDEARVIGVISIVYDHHQRELAAALIEAQHDAAAEIVCATHVHLDHHHCLEVILCRGTAGEVRQVADALVRHRGVDHGKVTMAAAGPVAGVQSD